MSAETADALWLSSMLRTGHTRIKAVDAAIRRSKTDVYPSSVLAPRVVSWDPPCISSPSWWCATTLGSRSADHGPRRDNVADQGAWVTREAIGAFRPRIAPGLS